MASSEPCLELACSHAPPLRGGVTLETARECDTRAWAEIIEPTPTAEREELVIPGSPDGSAEASAQPVDGLSAGRECVRHDARLEAPCLRVESVNAEPGQPNEFPDGPVNTLVG